MLWSQGIKIVWGGVQDASTHWSWAEHWKSYFGPIDYGWYGLQDAGIKDVVRAQIRSITTPAWQVQVHCCGDREQDWILESYMLARGRQPHLRSASRDDPRRHSHRLGAVNDAGLAEDAGLGYDDTNPDFMWWTEMIANSMGPFMSLARDADEDLPGDG